MKQRPTKTKIAGVHASRRRRESTDLVVEILRLAREGEKKSQIMATVGLSNAQSNRYFDRLSKSGFVTTESEGI